MAVKTEKLTGLKKGVLLRNYSTYKIGGPAKYLFIVKTKEDLVEAIKFAKSIKEPIFIFGGGSNILFSDKKINGFFIKIQIAGLEINKTKIYVGAGFNLTKLAYIAADYGLSGLEWAAGIPGATVGGSIYGHAQAFGDRMSDVVESVDVLDIKKMEFRNYTKEQCQFSLKNSIFKKNKNLVIVSAVLIFRGMDPEEIKNKIKENIKYRRKNHPLVMPSAGSTFVNPEIKIRNKKLLHKFPELAKFNERGVIPSGYLMQKCGLAGKKIGHAKISEKHSNFIINLGGAKAKDVSALMMMAQKKVKKAFGINLKPEVQFVGFKP